MKVFMIWYLAGELVLWAGPLPYDIETCRENAALNSAEIARKDTMGALTGLTIVCELRETKPKLRDKQ